MDRARHCPQGTSAVARVPRSARNGTRATVHKERLLWHTLFDPLAWIVRATALKGHLLWHGYRVPLAMEHGPPFKRNVCCGTPLLIPRMDRARHCPQGTSAVAWVPRTARNGT